MYYVRERWGRNARECNSENRYYYINYEIYTPYVLFSVCKNKDGMDIK